VLKISIIRCKCGKDVLAIVEWTEEYYVLRCPACGYEFKGITNEKNDLKVDTV